MEKVTFFSESFDSETFLAAAKAAGISSSKLDKARESYSLPEEGEFTFSSAEIVPEEKEKEIGAFVRLLTDTGHRISVNNLLSTAAFVPTKDVVKLHKSEAREEDGSKKDSFGAFFVKGERLNGGLPLNQALCVKNLLGKRFTAERKEGFVLPFEKKDGKVVYSRTEADAKKRLTLKSFYKLSNPIKEE